MGHDVISLGQAVPFFPPPPAVIAAGREAIGRPEVHRYATDPGIPSLRAALAERLSADARTDLSAADLIITAGANHAFALALTAILERADDEVVLPAPYFTNHQMMVVALGATAVEAPVADRVSFSLTWNDIEPQLTSRTRAVVLCNPSNPTGAAVRIEEGQRIVQKLADRGIRVISDETYMRFVYEGEHWSAASADGWRRNVIVIGTFSKSFGMMGWRVGFLLADAALCREAVKVQDAMIICAPVLSQVMAEAALRESWDYPSTFHDEFRQRRTVLGEALNAIPGVTWQPARGGMFAFVRIPGCDHAEQLSLDLLEHAHVVTIPGSAFGTSGEGYLRLSYGFATTAMIAEAVGRIHAFLGAGAS